MTDIAKIAHYREGIVMDELIEIVAMSQRDECDMGDPLANWEVELAKAALSAIQSSGKWVIVPRVPSEAMWGGLARAIIMAWDMDCRTPRKLFKDLEMSGHQIPDWLRNEPEMQAVDHVPSKGTRAVILYTAMIEASQTK